jgi:hypothetical protein
MGGASFTVKKVTLNPTNVGTSLVTEMFTLGRKLTAGEIQMIQLVFKSSIKPEEVRINKSFFAQYIGQGNAMTPWGTAHFPANKYKPDFSIESNSEKMWFIHEMTHIWQYQNGTSVAGKGLAIGCLGGYGTDSKAYNYDITVRNKPFRKYNMEQQADIIKHYYGAKFLNVTPREGKAQMDFLEFVIRPFLTNPSDKSLLPTIDWSDDASTYKFDN